MSTLRVDNIKSRTGSIVTIPEGQTLAVTGIGSIIGDTNVTGNLNVAGSFALSGGASFDTNAGIATFGNVVIGAATTHTQPLTVNGQGKFTDNVSIGNTVTFDAVDCRIHGLQEAHTQNITLTSQTGNLIVSQHESGALYLTDSQGKSRDLMKPTPIPFNSDTSLLVNRTYYADTTGVGTVYATLPLTPDVNDFVKIIDYGGYMSVNPLIVQTHSSIQTGPSSVIHGSGNDLEVNVTRAEITLTYTGIQTTGWLVK